MRPRKKIDCLTAERFNAWFKVKFKGRRVLRTAFQFFNWAAAKDDAKRTDMIARFYKHCAKDNISASWKNAARWYEATFA